MYTHAKLIHIMIKMVINFPVIVEQRLKLRGVASNDSEYHRQSEFACSYHRLRCTADRDPYIEVTVYGPGKDWLII